MPSPDIKGAGVVWGLATTISGTGVGTGMLVQSVNFGVEAENVETKNAVGDTKSITYYNHKQTLTIEVVPSAATIADARTANILPLPGALVTVADTVDTEVSGVHSGKYIFVSGSKNKSNVGVTTLTMNLMQFVETDLSTSAT